MPTGDHRPFCTYKEGEGLLELGHLLFGERIGLVNEPVSLDPSSCCNFISFRAPPDCSRGVPAERSNDEGVESGGRTMLKRFEIEMNTAKSERCRQRKR